VDEVGRLLDSLAAVVASARRLWGTLRGGEPGDRRAVGAGIFGVVGLALALVGSLSGSPSAEPQAYGLFALACQLPWIVLALPSAREDSRRRRVLHLLEQQHGLGADRRRKTRDWRRHLAASITVLSSPLEKSVGAEPAMAHAVQEFQRLTGYPLAPALIRRRGGGRPKVVPTRGSIADCLKVNTTLARGVDVYEYVDRHSPYPNNPIEHELVAGIDYFLVAAAEIDVKGDGAQLVIDCFMDLIDAALYEVGAGRNA
jgi:hypothetical protein